MIVGYILLSMLAFGDDNADQRLRREENKELVNDLMDKMTRVNDDTMCDVLLAESDPRLFFKYASILARRSDAFDLARYRKSEYPALSVFAEWQIALRQAEGIWLKHISERPPGAVVRVAAEESDEPLRLKSPIAGEINGIMKEFIKELEKRTDCEVPSDWKRSVESANFGGSCAFPNSEGVHDDAAKRARLALESGMLVIHQAGRAEAWALSVPIDSKVIDYCVEGDACFVALQTKELGCRELEVRAFKYGQKDATWESTCVTISCFEAIKWSNEPIVYMIASRDKGSVTFFINTGTAFGIDVLDAKTGCRRWCFSSFLPRDLHW